MNTPQEFFKDLYPGIYYKEETDTFIYRGHEFGYMLAGISFDLSRCSYLLVDKRYPHIWLFTFGREEDRWVEFINRVCEECARTNIPKLTFSQKIYQWFRKNFMDSKKENSGQNLQS